MSDTRRYYRVDLDFWHKTTCHKLLEQHGPWGPCVWLSMVAEAKRSSVPGVLIVTSMEALQDRLGLIDYELPFTLDEFLQTTGRLKQTSRSRVGRLLHVTLTHYGEWQKDWQRDADRDRQTRRRSQQNDRDTSVTDTVTPPVTQTGQSTRSSSIAKEDLDLGVSKGQNGASVNGTSPSGKADRLRAYVETVAWAYEPYSLAQDLAEKGATPDQVAELTAIAERKRSENAPAKETP
jgi:hypothetical protein